MHWFQLDFCGEGGSKGPSCCHQTGRRLLFTSVLGARYGPEFPAVFVARVFPCLTQNIKCALFPKGELKTILCVCWFITVIGRGGWGRKSGLSCLQVAQSVERFLCPSSPQHAWPLKKVPKQNNNHDHNNQSCISIAWTGWQKCRQL